MHGAHSGPTDAPPPIMPWAATAAIPVGWARVAGKLGQGWRRRPWGGGGGTFPMLATTRTGRAGSPTLPR